ncbi:MAG: TIGR02253 family HAD-type hydrolase [Candidatus Micrarchaeia archaeon]
MEIKYILFDIDDTLFPTTEFAERARKNAINAMIEIGLNKNPKKLYTMLLEIIKEKGSNHPNHFNILINKLKIKGPKSKYIASAVAAYHSTKNAIFPYPAVPRTLLKIRDRYRIYIASEGSGVKQWDKLIRLKIALFFDDVFISEDLKIKKSRKFYQMIIKLIKANPEECLMIGDKPDTDIKYAKQAGMKTIRLLTGKYSNEKSEADIEIKNFYNLLKAIRKLNSTLKKI